MNEMGLLMGLPPHNDPSLPLFLQRKPEPHLFIHGGALVGFVAIYDHRNDFNSMKRDLVLIHSYFQLILILSYTKLDWMIVEMRMIR